MLKSQPVINVVTSPIGRDGRCEAKRARPCRELILRQDFAPVKEGCLHPPPPPAISLLEKGNEFSNYYCCCGSHISHFQLIVKTCSKHGNDI